MYLLGRLGFSHNGPSTEISCDSHNPCSAMCRATNGFFCSLPKIWKPYTGPAAELLTWSRIRYVTELIVPESNNQMAESYLATVCWQNLIATASRLMSLTKQQPVGRLNNC